MEQTASSAPDTRQRIVPRRARPCGRDPAKPALLTRRMRRFPRCDWAGVVFPWPVFPRGSSLKLIWAGRAASQRWEAAFAQGTIDGLDAVDYAVAVFDKTAEFYAYMREVRIAQNRGAATLEDWYALVASIADIAHQSALEQLRERFPSADLAAFQDDAYLREFVLPAMDTQWVSFVDSPGGPPARRPYDEGHYLDRYVPDPASLAPRHFVQLNIDNEPDFEPQELWLDAYGKECPPPDTIPASAAPTVSTPPRAHPQSTLSSPESTGTSTTESTTSTATISVTSSFASTLNDSPTGKLRDQE